MNLYELCNKISDGTNKALLAVFGSRNKRLLNEMQPTVEKINSLEEKMNSLSQDELINRTRALQEQIKKGYEPINSSEKKELQEIQESYESSISSKERKKELQEQIKERYKEQKRQRKNEILDNILPEAYALVRESAKRTMGQRHFDVQLLGGIAMHQGKIAEMCTGEGKTIAATLPAYLNALSGDPVHIITVNDYLAERDKSWMGPIFEYLGLTVGAIKADMASNEKKKEYDCDITYGTNTEFGFDYLRDNMKAFKEDQVQRGFGFAIIDEVDNVLIDEARTPLIISQEGNIPDTNYIFAKDAANRLEKGEIIKNKSWFDNSEEEPTKDYVVKEKEHIITLTEDGQEKVEKILEELLGTKIELYTEEAKNLFWQHLTQQALNAKHFYHCGKDYLIIDGEVLIVDEFTGRLMHGRRWSYGLHQAIEAKEGVKIQPESVTSATITLQHLFKMYDRLAGMTGTAMTEAEEFDKIYGLDVVSIPTNKPLIRTDKNDLVYLTQKEKWDAIVQEIKIAHETGQPILVGTRDVKSSEYLSERLHAAGIQDHAVLNAKEHAREAEIIAGAGRKGAVTIATNMAGRGTDIELGGKKPKEAEQLKQWQEEHDAVVALGGLYVLGTERHEARRIDDQLRGRSGRQGDPGMSRFIISLEDDLMRLFIPDWLKTYFERLGMGNGEELEGRQITKAVANAQKKIEDNNFQIRKNLMEYDEILDAQRKHIYELRQKAVENNGLKDVILGFFNDKIQEAVYNPKELQDLDEKTLKRFILAYFDDKKYSPIAACMKDFGFDIKPEALEKSRGRLCEFLYNTIKKECEPQEEDSEKKEYEKKLSNDLKEILMLPEDYLIDPKKVCKIKKSLKKAVFEYYEGEKYPITECMHEFGIEIKPAELEKLNYSCEGLLCGQLQDIIKKEYEKKEESEKEFLEILEKSMILRQIDAKWQEHLYIMDLLKNSIGLRGYAQIDPKIAYKLEGSELFNSMLNEIQDAITSSFFKMKLVKA